MQGVLVCGILGNVCKMYGRALCRQMNYIPVEDAGSVRQKISLFWHIKPTLCAVGAQCAARCVKQPVLAGPEVADNNLRLDRRTGDFRHAQIPLGTVQLLLLCHLDEMCLADYAMTWPASSLGEHYHES